jgi:hypothetical protein
VLPAVGFLALGLVAMRNLSPAAIMLAPALGVALRAPATPGARRADAGTVNAAFLAVLAVAFVLFALSGISGRPLDERTYPAAAVRYMDARGLFDAPHRVAHSDVVGDYLILRNGRHARVFADDRFDMYPVEISNDVTTLIRGRVGALAVLRKWKIDVVLWEKAQPLVPLLTQSREWRIVATRGSWVVLRPT